MTDADGFEDEKPFWRCAECGHESHTRSMPPDRAKFFAKPEPAITCPSCKSPASFIPVGF